MANTAVRRSTRRRETDFQFICRVLKKRFHKYMQRNIMAVAVTGIIIGMCVGAFVGMKAANFAQTNRINDYGRDKTFTTYTVKPGDTIWGIAQDLAALNPEYNDIRQYVADIEKMNRLYTGEIRSGQIIYIPYYISHDGIASHEDIYLKYGIGD